MKIFSLFALLLLTSFAQAGAPFPAWTAIQVARLIPTNGITEIKIVAKVPR